MGIDDAEQPTAAEVFRNPTIPYDQKQRVTKTLIERTRVRPTTANFIQVRCKTTASPNCTRSTDFFALELDRRTGIVSAQVTTARPVPESSQDALRARLAALTGSEVRLQFAVDEELIGGIVTRIGSTVYDGSVRSQLQQIKEKISGEK